MQNRIVQGNILQIISQTERSQYRNKEKCIKLFYKLLKEGLKKPKKRKRRKISKSMKERRLKQKRFQSEKKVRRKKIDD